METTIVYWGYIGKLENEMETTLAYWGYIKLRNAAVLLNGIPYSQTCTKLLCNHPQYHLKFAAHAITGPDTTKIRMTTITFWRVGFRA